MQLHTEIKDLGLLVSDKKIFKVLPIGVYVKKNKKKTKKTRGPGATGRSPE